MGSKAAVNSIQFEKRPNITYNIMGGYLSIKEFTETTTNCIWLFFSFTIYNKLNKSIIAEKRIPLHDYNKRKVLIFKEFALELLNNVARQNAENDTKWILYNS